MSRSASSSRSPAGARARNASTSGRRPAFQSSMNSLRLRSRSVLTQNPLQFANAAAAALEDVVQGDAEPLHDLLGGKLLDVGQLEQLTVVVVLDLGDRPGDEALGLLVVGLVTQRLAGLPAQLGVVGGERGV